jgi:hypothetical protein
MTKNFEKITAEIFFWIKNYNLSIPWPPLRTSKLQKKPSTLKREHQALQNIKFLNFFLLLWVIFALVDPDPIGIRIRNPGMTIKYRYGTVFKEFYFLLCISLLLGLNGGYWDVIGVRGVVRERLEQQETLDNPPPPPPAPAPHLQNKKRKLSKSDSVDSATSECGRNRNQPAAKRKLVKSDSLDSNCSSQGSIDSSSPWAEYAPVTSSSPDIQSAVVVVTAGATKRKRISSAKTDRKRRKGLQDDVTTNSDSDVTTEGESQVMKTSMTASVPTTGHPQQSRRRSDGDGDPMEVERNCPELVPIAAKGGSCAELRGRLSVVSTNVEETVCAAETTTAELFNKSSMAATVSEKVSSDPHSKPSLTDDNLGLEAGGGDGGEDLNSSKDSEDVWASFRLKDEILDLEDNNEIWANTMDIFKSMEDMFANTTTTPISQQDDCTAAVDNEKSNKLEDVTSLANGTGDLSSTSPSHDEEIGPDRKSRRVPSYDYDTSAGDNPDSSKENKAVVVIKGTGAKRKSGGHSVVVSGKSSLHPDSKVSDRKCGPENKVSDRKCGLENKVSDRKCGGGRDPKSAVVGTTVDNKRKNLPASGRKAAFVTTSDKSETAAAGSSNSSCNSGAAAVTAAAVLPSSPRYAATPRTSSMVKLIEPSPMDPERLELLAKATSSNNKGRQSAESPLKTVSRRPKNAGSGHSISVKKNPSSTGSCFKKKLLSLLDREKARELAKIQGSKLPRKMQQQH